MEKYKRDEYASRKPAFNTMKSGNFAKHGDFNFGIGIAVLKISYIFVEY